MLHGHKQKEVAATMGVGLSTIQRWVSQYRKEQQGFTPKALAISPEQQRITLAVVSTFVLRQPLNVQ